jgi:hypothetical protein
LWRQLPLQYKFYVNMPTESSCPFKTCRLSDEFFLQAKVAD